MRRRNRSDGRILLLIKDLEFFEILHKFSSRSFFILYSLISFAFLLSILLVFLSSDSQIKSRRPAASIRGRIAVREQWARKRMDFTAVPLSPTFFRLVRRLLFSLPYRLSFYVLSFILLMYVMLLHGVQGHKSIPDLIINVHCTFWKCIARVLPSIFIFIIILLLFGQWRCPLYHFKELPIFQTMVCYN